MNVDELIEKQAQALAAWRGAQQQIPTAQATAAAAKAKADKAQADAQSALRDYQVANGAAWTLVYITEPAARKAYQDALAALQAAVIPTMQLI